jgi:hypothetical protein
MYPHAWFIPKHGEQSLKETSASLVRQNSLEAENKSQKNASIFTKEIFGNTDSNVHHLATTL